MHQFIASIAALAITASQTTAPTSRTSAWIEELKSSDSTTWRVAQVQLAHEGASALTDLNLSIEKSDSIVRERIRQTIDLMLLKSIEPSDLEQHQGLSDLVKVDLDRALQTTAPLIEAQGYDTGERGRAQRDGQPRQPSVARKALLDAVELGGFAVPAALVLCKGKTVGNRMYGIQLLLHLNATAQRSTLEELRKDSAPIWMSYGDYTERTTIGAVVTATMKSRWPFRTGRGDSGPPTPAELGDEYVYWFDHGSPTCELMNYVRQNSKSRDAKTWEEFWIEAEPAMREYFRTKKEPG